MRILEVRFKNLNSLRGEHFIDLAAEPLASAGLFAITGPTGSGKSTILDAITLALYGRSARYGSDPKPVDMMSRHCGECSAEVTFSVASGAYRAEWQLRRARGKADGKLQDAKRYIYELEGTVLAQQIREADRLIEELSGLSYERFMRSVMLAQGEFARFLKAKADERAELLESLTGTVIYSELSRLAHEELSRQQQELSAKELELGLIELLSDETRAEKKEAIAATLAESDKLKTSRSNLESTISNSETLSQQEEIALSLHQKLEQIKADRKKEAEAFVRLEHHQRVIPLVPALERYEERIRLKDQQSVKRQQAEKAQAEAEEALGHGVQTALAFSTNLLQTQGELLARAEDGLKHHRTSRAEVESWLETNRRDESLSSKLGELLHFLGELKSERQRLTSIREEQSALQEDLGKEEGALKSYQADLSSGKEQLEKVEASVKKTERDLAELTEGETVSHLRDRQTAMIQRRHRLEELVTSVQRLNETRKRQSADAKVVEKLDERLKNGSVIVEQRSQDATKAAELLESYQEHLKTAEKVAGLEEHRTQLVDGEPCPLCGSEIHPYADDESSSTKIDSLKEQIIDANKEKQAADKLELEARTLHAKLESERDSTHQQLNELSGEATELGSAVSSLTKTLQLPDSDETTLHQLIEKLDGDYNQISERLKQTEALQQVASEAAHAVVATKSRLETQQDRVSRSHEQLDKIQGKQAEVSAKLKACEAEVARFEDTLNHELQPFDESSPAEGQEEDLRKHLEKRFALYREKLEKLQESKDLISDSETQAKEFRDQKAETELSLGRLAERSRSSNQPPEDSTIEVPTEWAKLADAEEAVHSLEALLKTAEATYQERHRANEEAILGAAEAEQELFALIKSSEFESLEALKASRLSQEDLESIRARKEELDASESEAVSRIKANTELIEQLQKKDHVDGEALSSLKDKRNELDLQLDSLAGRSATLKAELEKDDENRARQESQEMLLEEERKRMKSWEMLHGLIGSHDGRKFRRFAQGISLDGLIFHANRHLCQFSDRYQLQRREGEELDLEIVDHYQAEVTRPMSSLSGGESFLASLALALGLSALAGRNVRIESLFIDEGFGTLDPETLDIALSALEVLRLSNKTIGVISHVEMLKERISTQVEVTKLPGGMSRLSVATPN